MIPVGLLFDSSIFQDVFLQRFDRYLSRDLCMSAQRISD